MVVVIVVLSAAIVSELATVPPARTTFVLMSSAQTPSMRGAHVFPKTGMRNKQKRRHGGNTTP